MMIKKCDSCGVSSELVNEKDFFSLSVNFGTFSGKFDFCPKCWATKGGEIISKFSPKQDVEDNAEDYAVDPSLQ